MNVRFLMRTPPGQKDAVEYVELSGLYAGDVTCRRATDEDRSRYKTAYRAFKAEQAPKPVEKPKALAKG